MDVGMCAYRDVPPSFQFEVLCCQRSSPSDAVTASTVSVNASASLWASGPLGLWASGPLGLTSEKAKGKT
jgi:anti-sigma factor RsiW